MFKIMVLFLLAGSSVSAIAEKNDELEAMEQAEKLYKSGQFAAAAEVLEKIVDDRSDPSLLYNLGNAYYKAQMVGPAMAAYVGALALQSNDADLRANIRFVEKGLQDKVTAFRQQGPMALLFFWAELPNLRALFYATAMGLCAWFLAVGLKLANLVRFEKTTMILVWGGGALVVMLASGLAYRLAFHQKMGAVTAEVAEIYSAPTKQAGQKIFELKAGAPFWVEAVSADWLKISISDGKSGWVNEDSVRSYH